MTIEKLPSGSYRITEMRHGKRYRITVDHKPRKAEAEDLIEAKIWAQGDRKANKGTLCDYANKYISEGEKAGYSPSTLRGYHSIIRNTPQEYLSRDISDFTQEILQRMVDEFSRSHASSRYSHLSEGRSAKSVINFNGFYKAVFSRYKPSFPYNVNLPKRTVKTSYRPTTKEIMAILKEVEGTEFSVAFQLGALGLRRGEICALTIDDLKPNNALYITKDIVINSQEKYVLKETAKTAESNRIINLPESLANEIRQQGYVYRMKVNTLNSHLQLVQKKLGIDKFTFHTLRHFSAAYLHKMGFTREQIREWHGWSKSTNVDQLIYTYNLDPDEQKQEIASAFGRLL